MPQGRHEHKGYTIAASGFGFNPWHVERPDGSHVPASNHRSVKDCRAWLDRRIAEGNLADLSPSTPNQDAEVHP